MADARLTYPPHFWRLVNVSTQRSTFPMPNTMIYKVLLVSTLLSPQVLSGLAKPLDIIDTLDNLITPPSIGSTTASPSTASSTNSDDDLVRTPAGLVPRGNTHFVPGGALVRHNDTYIDTVWANGTVMQSAPLSGNPSNPFRNTNRVFTRDVDDGSVAFAYWKNVDPSPIADFRTYWDVPQIPDTTDGQLLFVFNALASDSFDIVLQPVLQYGSSAAGGGNYWAAASWFVVGEDVYYTSLASLSPGQILRGLMTLESTTSNDNATIFSFDSGFIGLPSSYMSVSSTKQLTYAYEALQVYNASGPSDLPRGGTALRDIAILNQDGQFPAVAWTADNDEAEGFGTVVVVMNGTDGEVDIIYPTSQTISAGIPIL